MFRVGAKNVLINLAVILAFGVFIPWRKGYDFLDGILIVCYALLSLLFVAPTIADFMSAHADSARRLFSAITRAVVYSWGISVVILLLGILTVNLTNRRGGILYPSPKLLASALWLGLVACVFVAAASAFLTLLFSSTVAKTVLRIGFLVLLVLILFGPRFLPVTWQDWLARQMTTDGLSRLVVLCSGIVVLADAVLLAALRSVPQRSR